jgi:ABC-type multidrug transport system fused ATPase/permease subunit
MKKPPKKKITREGFRNAFKLWGYIRPYGKEYLLGMFFLLGSSLANLAFPKLLGDIVNSGNQGTLGQTLNQTGLFLIALLIVQSVFSYFRIVLFVNVTEKSLALLRRATYNHLIIAFKIF